MKKRERQKSENKHEGMHTVFLLSQRSLFCLSRACDVRNFGSTSANLIGQCAHTRTLGYEVVRSNSANQRGKKGWVERGRESWKGVLASSLSSGI